MKILFTRFPFESAHGGAEAQTLSLMKGLKKRGHAVAFLGSCPTLLVLCEQHKIPCAPLDIGLPPVSKKTLLSFLWRKKAMKQKLEGAFKQFCEHGLDAIFMLSLSEKLLLTQTSVDSGIPTFWIEHDSIGPWLTRNPLLRSLRKLNKLVTTIGVSKLSRKLYVNLGWDSDKTISIPNGIDALRFYNIKQLGECETFDRPRIGCVARLAKEKGVDLLIKAMRDVPYAHLSIVGLGPEHDNLEKLIGKLDLDDRVTIIPRKGNLAAFYRSIDIFVLPSRSHDPFGLVACEAMILDVPVIVTDACGIAEELEHEKDAYIVKANSKEALAEGMSDLLNDEKKRREIAHVGQKKAHSEFTEASMIDRYEQLILHNR